MLLEYISHCTQLSVKSIEMHIVYALITFISVIDILLAAPNHNQLIH